MNIVKIVLWAILFLLLTIGAGGGIGWMISKSEYDVRLKRCESFSKHQKSFNREIEEFARGLSRGR